MKVYVIIDNLNSCYDHGHQFHSVHSTKEKAEQALQGYEKGDLQYFDIEEHEI